MEGLNTVSKAAEIAEILEVMIIKFVLLDKVKIKEINEVIEARNPNNKCNLLQKPDILYRELDSWHIRSN